MGVVVAIIGIVLLTFLAGWFAAKRKHRKLLAAEKMYLDGLIRRDVQ